MTKKYIKIFLFVLLAVLFPILIFAYYIPSEEERRPPTEINYQGANSGQYSDSVNLKAKLVAKVTQEGLKGKEVTFTLETQQISTTTDDQGIAQTNLVLNQGSGDYTLLTIFGGDQYFAGCSDSDSFKILKEDTTLTYTGPTSAPAGSTITVKAELSELDEEVGDLSGKKIIFKIGSLQESGLTDSDGRVEKTMSLNGLSPGTYDFTTEFEGDALYLASSDSDSFQVTGGGGGGCFIATAAFGSPLASEINILRKFRDQYLLTNSFGEWLVSKYYQYSPPLADYIEEREILKGIVRIGLKPLIELAKLLVD